MTSGVCATSIRPKLAGRYYSPAGLIVAVDGTMYPGAPLPPHPATNDGNGFWSGFASAMVGGLENTQDGLWHSVCIGYEALTIPMWKSVQAGRGNLQTPGTAVFEINAFQQWFYQQFGTFAPTILAGFSQGTMITDQVWLYDILSVTGALHYLLPFTYRIYQFGHVFRSPGIAWGNALAGLSQSIITDGQESGGIGCALDLTVPQTNYPAPDDNPVIVSCANPGDLYSACPTGLDPWNHLAKEGKTGQLFFRIVMKPTFVDVVEAAEVLGMPISAIKEAVNAGTFFSQGMDSPHYHYEAHLVACIDDALALGRSLPYQSGF
jgi:hypothetical protein